MAKRKLTSEQRLKRIRLHKIIVQISIALGVCGFVVLVILNNVFPDMDNWLSRHGYSVTLALISQGIVQLFINKRWSKNPDLYDTPPDERDAKLNGQTMLGVVGIYFLLSCVAILVTFILALLKIISIFVPAIIIGNLFVLSLIFIIVSAIVRKRNS